ncbi:CHAD domain-containing protein [Rhizobium sp. VS19-DR104.2]|uniref:CYTH and CHAD domain-containing protein n=1 Tax=unclassified Rhizobium TaxID=2613769 RepID=UPI001C5A747A|nr:MULTISPECIES: CHAD domain-containing protein [unclassified Rhizobium]MBZ5758846.1 CHAD domain-containing protein [Rhizobium sp. VS19-DR96]MBZ5764324.1 CHAD domain-containing protein [Rhizobium sp. VS19-DR129.2]MBZ5771867.1 CHAD domain-containing protein [Rhizobium sp. VS19-DRK62.2]MBZ5783446.1 CHAD domain-containing protein [Rhizobium sp. VS19-DR121]MBZ5800894.1 CHAD domain-containing protein [Rhizobium sp. VS19-DR181]
MTREIELKLELSQEAKDRLLNSPLLGEPLAVFEQRALYFDTPDQTLRNAGFSLRIRQAGDVRTQTIKATHQSTAGLFARPEWESIVETDVPVLDHTAPISTDLWPDLDADQLVVQFIVQVQRKKWLHREDGSEIEIVVDEGIVIAGDRRSPVCEVELELKDGNTLDLFRAARKIQDIDGLRLGVLSKSERGYALVAPLQNFYKAEPVQLDRTANAVTAFQTIGQSCFRQFRLNETVLADRRNPEALHQARVSLRRLRSALSIFKPILVDPEAGRIAAELKWLASIMGDARNFDILVSTADNGELRDRLKVLRTEKYDLAIEAMASPRARRVAMDFIEWLWCGAYLEMEETREARHAPASEFASHALDRLRKTIRRNAKLLADGTDTERHEVRKDAKKLRYAAEFFASLFSDKQGRRRHREFVKALEKLQEHLGGVNDLATAPAVLRDHGLEDHPDAGRLSPTGRKTKLLQASADALDDLLDVKRFWR